MASETTLRLRNPSRQYAVSGALGGAVAFMLMEASQQSSSYYGGCMALIGSGIYFAGFGLSVGAALGATQGILEKQTMRALYGLCLGAVLGLLGGFFGGLVGQMVYSAASHSGPGQILARALGWGILGALIGVGQGVRENTREDLKACALGGLVGGLAGGLLFDPIAAFFPYGTGTVARLFGDVIVGAAIGGSMRLLQEKMVDPEKKRTTLTTMLPKNPGLSVLDD